MAKKTNIPKTTTASTLEPAAAVTPVKADEKPAAKLPKAAVKKPAAKKTKPKAVAETEPAKKAKAPAKFKVRAAAVSKKEITSSKVEITSDDIALRAYYITEKRQKLGLTGDSASDWLEAERQLKAEAKLAAKAPKA